MLGNKWEFAGEQDKPGLKTYSVTEQVFLSLYSDLLDFLEES